MMYGNLFTTTTLHMARFGKDKRLAAAVLSINTKAEGRRGFLPAPCVSTRDGKRRGGGIKKGGEEWGRREVEKTKIVLEGCHMHYIPNVQTYLLHKKTHLCWAWHPPRFKTFPAPLVGPPRRPQQMGFLEKEEVRLAHIPCKGAR